MTESQEEGAVNRGREGLLETLRTYNLGSFLSHFCLRAAFLSWLNPVIPVSKTTNCRDSSFSEWFKFLCCFVGFFLQKSRKHVLCKKKNNIKTSWPVSLILQYLPFYSSLFGIITWINLRILFRKHSYTQIIYLFSHSESFLNKSSALGLSHASRTFLQSVQVCWTEITCWGPWSNSCWSQWKSLQLFQWSRIQSISHWLLTAWSCSASAESLLM